MHTLWLLLNVLCCPIGCMYSTAVKPKVLKANFLLWPDHFPTTSSPLPLVYVYSVTCSMYTVSIVSIECVHVHALHTTIVILVCVCLYVRICIYDVFLITIIEPSLKKFCYEESSPYIEEK